MPRFFIDTAPQGEVFLDGETGVHITRSLRMKPGEQLTLCAGDGFDHHCTITECTPQGAWVRVDSTCESKGEPAVQVTVCQCLPKGDKLETVTQKAVELGAAAIQPIESSRCISRPDAKSAAKKIARLQKIALEAAQQSERGKVPQVLPITPLKDALAAAAEHGTILFCYEKGTISFRSAISGDETNYFVFVGPEGGFSEEEAELAQSFGAKLLTLGPRILRTETAPLAALAAICYEKGEFEQ